MEKLHKAIRLLEWILERCFKQKTSKTKYRHFADKIHVEHTTLKQNCNGNKNECSAYSAHTQVTHVIFCRGKRDKSREG